MRTYADAAAGRQAVLDGDVVLLASPSGGTASSGGSGATRAGGGYRVVVDKDLGDSLTVVLTVAARQAALAGQISALGGDPATVGRAVATAGVDVTALHHAPARDGSRLLLGLLAGGLIYISLLIFGPAVAQSVIEEKTSRGVVALGQLVLIGVVGVGLGLATGDLGIPTGIAVGSVAAALLWYLIGFAMYALMFAAAGALVSRQEDAGGVTAPMILMIIIPYVLGISVLPSTPDSGLIGALAIVPLSAPMLMPMVIGISIGSVAVWQVLVALALSLAWIAVLVWLAGRVYGNAVKRSGTRVPLREALRAA